MSKIDWNRWHEPMMKALDKFDFEYVYWLIQEKHVDFPEEEWRGAEPSGAALRGVVERYVGEALEELADRGSGFLFVLKNGFQIGVNGMTKGKPRLSVQYVVAGTIETLFGE